MKDNINPWLDKWQEGAEIDRGGQGYVTELRHKEKPNQRAVLKRIVPRWQADLQARQRLQQEAETLLKLHELGARVPEVYDSLLNYSEVEPFLLMEFIEGIRFDEWLKIHAPVVAPKAVLITHGVADTISLCHQHSIGHRDLKPSNIILRNGDIVSPYVLDFGISFDSQQTIILTHDGEMFWNEFIILPECQDLGGGHRDLRSDITALAGIFFACLTGRPPIVLLDVEERAPHQKHEHLLLDSAETLEQGERLSWFFDRAFAYRVADRFQTLDEFSVELTRFADSSPQTNLDLMEQFDILDQVVSSTDRNVQLVSLRKKYINIIQSVNVGMQKELKALKERNGQTSTSDVRVDKMTEPNKPNVKDGDILDPQNAYAFTITREHFQHMAVALLSGFGVGMQIHLYSTSYCAPSGNASQPDKPLVWAKVAVFDENTLELDKTKQAVIVDDLKAKLAHEIRNLARQKKS